ncbi:hypothetical protein ABPG74_019131 [Tetrahymena malaccensis]
MSAQDLQVLETRHKQGETMKSKDQELLREKIFGDDDSLWNDTQLTLNGLEEHKFKLNQNDKNQQNSYSKQNIIEQNQRQSFNSRRGKHLNRSSISRTRIIEADLSNKNGSIKQIYSEMHQNECVNTSNYWQNTCRWNTIKINTLFNTHPYFFRNLTMITKIKLKMKHFLDKFTNIKRSRLINSEIRQLINDQSDILMIEEDFLQNVLMNFNKWPFFKHFQIPLFKLSSQIGFYIKLILTLINIVYLLLLSIFIVLQVEDYFSKTTQLFINFFWLIDILFNVNCQAYVDNDIITEKVTIIGDILSEISTKDLKQKQDTNTINKYMRQYCISEDLQAQVNMYLQQYYQNNFLDEQSKKELVLEKLPIDLLEHLKREQFKGFIIKLDNLFNKILSVQTLQELCKFMQEEFYLPNQILSQSRDQSLQFIIQGQLQEFKNKEQFSQNKKIGQKLQMGDNLGLIDFISGISSDSFVISTMFTKIVKINRLDFLRVIQKNDLDFQNRKPFQRNLSKNNKSILLQHDISAIAQSFIYEIKKQKQIDIIQLLDLTLSDTDDTISDEDIFNKKKFKYQESLNEFQPKSNSCTQIQYEQTQRRQRVPSLNLNKVSKEFEDQQKGLDLNQIQKSEFFIDKVTLQGIDGFKQHSLNFLSEKSRVGFKDHERKNNKEEFEKQRFQDEKKDGSLCLNNSVTQLFPSTSIDNHVRSSKLNFIIKYITENFATSSQKEIIQQANKQTTSNQKFLNQLFLHNNKNASLIQSINQFQNFQELNLKNNSVSSGQFINHQFDQQKDHINYFPQGLFYVQNTLGSTQIVKRFYLNQNHYKYYGQQDFPSFYELWNFCFPQKIQIKKKLSRFDPKIFKKRSNRLIKNDASNQVNNLPKSSMHIPITNQKHNLNQNTLQSYEKTIFQDKDHSDKLQEIKQEINYFSDNSKIHSQKKQINNHIFEDEEEQDYQPINSQQLPFYEEKEKFYEQNMCTQKECQDYDHQFLQLKDYNNQYFFDFETQHSFQNIYQPSDYQQFYQYQ